MKRRIFTCLLTLLAAAFSQGLLPRVYSLEIFQPVEVDYSTYLGGTDIEYGNAIAVDSNGSAYVAGSTDSEDFPTFSAYQAGGSGAFVSKLSPTGSLLVFSTYLGGSSYDHGYGIALDSALCVYVAGETHSSDFPTVNPYQSSHAGGNVNIFVSKFSSAGSELLYSTYLGGSGNHEEPYQIVVDSNGSAYVTGNSTSQNFPTVNPYQASYGGGGIPEILGDAFVTKFSSTGSELLFSTYLGGSNGDRSRDMVLGSDNCVYLAGNTSSDNFPTVNPYQSSHIWNIDAFVSKLSSSGSSLVYSTYLGGDHHDTAHGIALHSGNCLYVVGDTFSDTFPTLNPYQSTRTGNTYDAFVTRFSTSGSSLLYSTYLGGSDDDYGKGIALGAGYFAYITGYTSSQDFPTVNSYQAAYGGGNDDAFVSKLSCWGRLLLYSTYLGGNNSDDGTRIVMDFQDNAYVVGSTQSTNFPLENPYQSTPDESWGNAFITKLYQPTLTPVYASGDYNGDGTSDIAIFREDPGTWYIRGVTSANFGTAGDLPVPGDYDLDGSSDIGLYRPSSGLWAIRGLTRAYFGSAADQPVPGDYDGDGYCDVAVFRPDSGLWAIRDVGRAYLGGPDDRPVPGDYSGDGTCDIGVYRTSARLWAIKGVTRAYFGGANDYLVPGDFDGDGTREAGLFRPGSGLWAIRGLTRVYFGDCEDQPVPADYNGDGADDPGAFRPSSGLWAVRGISRVYYGASGDIPVTR